MVFLFLLFAAVSSNGQIYRYRLNANSGIFLGEVGRAETEPSETFAYPGAKNFVPVLKPGAELEISRSVTPDFELGLQLGYLNLNGETPTAPMYNFFLSRNNPLPDNNKYPKNELYYNTNIFSVSATTRFYILPLSDYFNFFLKAQGGVSFIGTDFSFKDPVYSVENNIGTLFSKGTRNSKSPKAVVPAGGAGFGMTYRLSDKFDVYFDATASLIRSDIVNGVPNYDYKVIEGKTIMQKSKNTSAVVQAGLGLIYSAVPDRKYHKSNFTRSGRISKNLFHKSKKNRAFKHKKPKNRK